MARRKIDFIYQECDIPRTEEIERYMRMSDDDRKATLKKLIEEDRREYQMEREREKGK